MNVDSLDLGYSRNEQSELRRGIIAKMTTTPRFTDTKILIVGGGISGMAMAIELITRYKIKDIVIIEKSGGFGGTWRDNIYPGAACDVFSSLYSFSFAQKFDFTRSLPGQEEILVRLGNMARLKRLTCV